MKKKLFKKLKDAYFEELKKMGVINSVETKAIEKPKKTTKKAVKKVEK